MSVNLRGTASQMPGVDPIVIRQHGRRARRLPLLAPASARCSRLGSSELYAVVIPSYTDYMKTAISIPDHTFTAVERRASDLGWTRSQFYSTAAVELLHRLDERSVTSQIDEVLSGMETEDESSVAAIALGRTLLRNQENTLEDEEW